MIGRENHRVRCRLRIGFLPMQQVQSALATGVTEARGVVVEDVLGTEEANEVARHSGASLVGVSRTADSASGTRLRWTPSAARAGCALRGPVRFDVRLSPTHPTPCPEQADRVDGA